MGTQLSNSILCRRQPSNTMTPWRARFRHGILNWFYRSLHLCGIKDSGSGDFSGSTSPSIHKLGPSHDELSSNASHGEPACNQCLMNNSTTNFTPKYGKYLQRIFTWITQQPTLRRDIEHTWSVFLSWVPSATREAQQWSTLPSNFPLECHTA